jgi:DNA-binding NtrC family response regulator
MGGDCPTCRRPGGTLLPGPDDTCSANAADPTALARADLVGESPAWREAVRRIERLAACDATTLIEGETGTGKEVAARAIHYIGARRERPFVPINCGALPDNLLEAELFGHEKGAFTGADDRRTGLVSAARLGTLFLDEVEAMTPRAQVVVLRFVQDHSYLPVGGRQVLTADVRVIAATNADLNDLADRGLFRRDLLFRLRVLSLRLPPLRERNGDAVLLAQTFLERCSTRYHRPAKGLSPRAREAIGAREWPGNVRELESLVERAFLMGDGDELILEDDAAPPGPAQAGSYREAKARALAEFERAYLARLLSTVHGNLSMAARIARKDRGALRRMLRKHGLNTVGFRAAARPGDAPTSMAAP